MHPQQAGVSGPAAIVTVVLEFVAQRLAQPAGSDVAGASLRTSDLTRRFTRS
ncbi:MAG TPA: hypothetical protein VIL94_00655 [Acidothermaceae bacterium]